MLVMSCYLKWQICLYNLEKDENPEILYKISNKISNKICQNCSEHQCYKTNLTIKCPDGVESWSNNTSIYLKIDANKLSNSSQKWAIVTRQARVRLQNDVLSHGLQLTIILVISQSPSNFYTLINCWAQQLMSCNSWFCIWAVLTGRCLIYFSLKCLKISNLSLKEINGLLN